jgi:hypothetical protein
MREERVRQTQQQDVRAECPDHVLLRQERSDTVDSDQIERARRARLRLRGEAVEYVGDTSDD